MATVENRPNPSTERPIGFGRLKRKEDARFIRGKGTYLDDINLPGMLHGAILRSPYTHAKIVSIDTSAALAHPNVAAVITAKDLETLGLAWMPTISYDTQAVLAGDSPIVAALRRIGPELGLALVAAEDGAAPAPGDLGLVVAAHGRDELPILRGALEAGVPYVGLVGSRKRGAAVLEQLRADGVAEQLLASVDTPAGLDIGARSAAEIAVSILARIVEVRRRAAVAAPADAAARPNTAVDPICGMTIVVGSDTPSLEQASGRIYFCCMGCKLKFEERHGHAAATG